MNEAPPRDVAHGISRGRAGTASSGTGTEPSLDRSAVVHHLTALETIDRERRDVDQYGRKLRVVLQDGRSVGEDLIARGLAHRWEGQKLNWCG